MKVDEFESSNYERYTLGNVELDVNYILVISSNAGLWAYNTGDTVKFTSLNPPKILVTGRYKHFISAFGEHVIVNEVEQSIAEVCKKQKINILEFTIAPMINPKHGLPYHEWWIEFEERNVELNVFSGEVDKKLQEKNIYYKDLIKGKVLKTDTVVISGTAKFDNEYPIENLWHDKNGDLGAVRISNGNSFKGNLAQNEQAGKLNMWKRCAPKSDAEPHPQKFKWIRRVQVSARHHLG